MTIEDTQAIPPMGDPRLRGAAIPAPRLRGARVPVLPSGPLLAQLAGGAATLAGVLMTWGLGVTLIVGGVAAVALGALRESKKI